MSESPLLPEVIPPPQPAIEFRFAVLEGRVSALEQHKADKQWTTELVTAIREKLREDIKAGIEQIHQVMLERQRFERSRDDREKALLSVCEETQILIKGLATKGE